MRARQNIAKRYARAIADGRTAEAARFVERMSQATRRRLGIK